MSDQNISGRLMAFEPLPRWLVDCGLGFIYWFVFLLVLEPDNALRARESGHTLAIGHEVLRMTVAALLGASITPAVLSLARRYPLHGIARWRHALWRAAGISGLAFGLIVASCFLAAWGFYEDWLPTFDDLREELISNWLLLAFALAALHAVAHLVHRPAAANSEPEIKATAPTCLTRVAVKTRGRQGFVQLDEIDWIETQGNYLALHAGSRTHLIRAASVAFEAQLDPARFLRVHRRAIVAIDRIRGLQPLTNGDALLCLADGQELRASRRYRKLIAERWSQSSASTHAIDNARSAAG
ncbi:MAG TPA: LytTR family DNA-binding domain-containing protein [Rhodanobacter sp.]